VGLNQSDKIIKSNNKLIIFLSEGKSGARAEGIAYTNVLNIN